MATVWYIFHTLAGLKHVQCLVWEDMQKYIVVALRREQMETQMHQLLSISSRQGIMKHLLSLSTSNFKIDSTLSRVECEQGTRDKEWNSDAFMLSCNGFLLWKQNLQLNSNSIANEFWFQDSLSNTFSQRNLRSEITWLSRLIIASLFVRKLSIYHSNGWIGFKRKDSARCGVFHWTSYTCKYLEKRWLLTLTEKKGLLLLPITSKRQQLSPVSYFLTYLHFSVILLQSKQNSHSLSTSYRRQKLLKRLGRSC